MKKSLLLTLLATSVVTLGSCNNSTLEKRELSITKQNGEIVTLKAEIAKTEEEKAKGYMERENIPEGTGMLFVFKTDKILAFWMKDTPTPLSIAYIDSKGKIRDIFDMEPYSLTGIYSSVSARYALEVPQGWFEKMGIRENDVVTIPNDLN